LAYTNNNTVSKMQSSKAEDLAHEQAYVTALYERLDVLRAATAQRLAAVWVGGTTETDQALSERDSLADEYQERGAELETAERNLCFGRLDFDDGDRLYIGRLTLRSAERDLLLADWRAKASQPFYRATQWSGTASPAAGTCGPRAGGSSAWTTTCSTWTPSTRPT
jgi:DNA helicase IV